MDSIFNRSFSMILAIGLLLTIAIRPVSAQPPESDDPIIITVSDWSSQIVLSRILGTIYRNMGYDILYEEVEYWKQLGLLHRGKIHVQVEIWETSQSATFERMLKNGNIVSAGKHLAITREGWWYPAYVTESCPGLPDWKAMNRCASLFATIETAPKGRFLAGYWDKHEEARIRAMSLNFIAEIVNDADELWRELHKAIAKKEPILLLNWEPNWVQDRYEGSFIEFPKYDPKCINDPSWGISKKWTYDCGLPMDRPLRKAAWAGMVKKWPCAWKTLQRMQLTSTMLSRVAAFVDVDGISHAQAAEQWLKESQDVWQDWIPKECRTANARLVFEAQSIL
jgi:glycine betaine/proline transport system substrate-binding protein